MVTYLAGALLPGEEGSHQDGEMDAQNPRKAWEWEALVANTAGLNDQPRRS